MIRLFDRDEWEEIMDSLSKNRTRTLLTAFGIFWGVFMLLLLMGGGRGLETVLGNQFAGFASNSGLVFARSTSMPYKGLPAERSWNLELSDVKRIKNCVHEVDICTPSISKWGSSAKAGMRSCSVSLMGMYADYTQVDNPKITRGRSINDADNSQCRKVCVIGSRVVENLFPELGHDADPCGQFVQVDGVYYCVVGVSGKTEGSMQIGGNPTTTVYLPFNTMQRAYNMAGKIDVLCLTARGSYRMSEVQKKVETLIKRIHRIHPNDPQAVASVNTEAMFSMVDSLFAGVSILVWMIGLGTLMAGAIGVSNIMIVTVKERTTEIGIRRAIGATPADIVGMIMAESIVLTLMSGMSGITLAVLLLQVLEEALADTVTGAHFQISFSLAFGSAALLSVLGVLAGFAPAFRAMKIKPVDAMREE